MVKTIDWVRFLAESDVGYGRHYFAPWVAHVLAFAGKSMGDAWYDEVIEADCEMVRACDGIILLGGRVSPGMDRERQAALDAGIFVLDCSAWTSPLDAPPFFHRVDGWNQLWTGL